MILFLFIKIKKIKFNDLLNHVNKKVKINLNQNFFS